MNDPQRTTADPFDPTLIPGRPGYRTRPGRSGYDPFETRLEMGYMVGLLIRKILRGIRRLIFNRKARTS